MSDEASGSSLLLWIVQFTRPSIASPVRGQCARTQLARRSAISLEAKSNHLFRIDWAWSGVIDASIYDDSVDLMHGVK